MLMRTFQSGSGSYNFSGVHLGLYASATDGKQRPGGF
jgi:hypothetical protein